MRQLFIFLFLSMFSVISFALPNIKLSAASDEVFEINNDNVYDKNGNQFMTIRNGKLYEIEKDTCIGTISEDKEKIYINLEDEKFKIYSFDFDKSTGLILKAIYYKDNSSDISVVFEYEKEKLIKSTNFDKDNTITGYTIYSYDKKTGKKSKESYYNESNILSSLTEFDIKTDKRIKQQEFNDDGTVKNQTIYDKNTGNAIERLIYEQSSKKPTKWTFLKFDDNGKYSLNDEYYLTSSLCSYRVLADYAEKSKESPIDWNENYSVIVRKFDFTKLTDGYAYIENLRNKHYLSSSSFALCKENSNFSYCFNTSENDEIDISSCYEIEFIKKAPDYSMFRKSKGGGAFGFDIGMTYEEVKEACGGSEPEHIADDRYYVKPKKAHPLFEKYIVWINDSVGLYYIKGISRNINTTSYGTEVKNKFKDLLSSLEKKYGKFEMTDTIKEDYYFKDEQYWMTALRDGARTYKANWTATKENYKNFNGIMNISTGTEAYYSTSANIWIEYAFINYFDAQESVNDAL